MLDTLQKGPGDAVTQETKQAWTTIHGVLSTTMIAVAEYAPALKSTAAAA